VGVAFTHLAIVTHTLIMEQLVRFRSVSQPYDDAFDGKQSAEP
jgi:hypothetical protein